MATLAETQAAAAELDALWAILAADFAAETAGLVTLSPTEVAGLLRDLAAEFAEEYGAVASLLMADWYETLRPGSDGFDTVLVSPDLDALQRNIGWAATPLFEERVDAPAALSRTEEVVELAASDAARLTIITNARRDPLDVRYARYASATACAFCAMLATRQATYRSEDSAGFKAHRSCHCIAVPVWPGDVAEEAPYVAEWRDVYHEARSTAKVSGDTSTKATLAQMRRIGGLR